MSNYFDDNKAEVARDYGNTLGPRQTTISEKLANQQQELQRRQDKISRLQELLSENPLFEEFMNLTREIL